MLGLYELLHFLKARHIKMAVATSSFPKIIQAVFDKLKLWGYFILQCSADDEQFGKPHPAVYLKTIQKLGISSKECLVIEDSVVGLIAAKQQIYVHLL
ncbi:HAD family phosphatase [Pasteurella multocida]|uniref:HAD family hydrolase n=1 Tax=Pasteurella multocida TaxID=747 RepID=UPI0020255522|nr:HAD family phosphatase [Pasteurella multocida]URJ85622.1 HAD family phosphatase [Pasteurella multocida]